MRAVIGPKAADYVETAVDSAVDIVSSAGWKAAVALSGLKSMTLDEESAGSEAKSEPFVIKFEIKEGMCWSLSSASLLSTDTLAETE